jgi:hypothetical protein
LAYNSSDTVSSLTLLAWNGSSLVPQRQATYTYLAGLAADLESVTTSVYNPAGDGSWVAVGMYYMRYNTYSDLSLSLTPQEVANATGIAASDPAGELSALQTASNFTLQTYAGVYYDYTGHGRDTQVSDAYLDGGSQHYSYTYSIDSSGGSSLGTWFFSTVQTRPDGSAFTLFANIGGQTLFTNLNNGSGEQWDTAYVLGTTAGHNAGLIVMTATPSAIDMSEGNSTLGEQGFDSTSSTLDIAYYADAGQITRYTYGAATTDDPAPVGYVESETLAQGTSGDQIPQAAYTYTTHTGYVDVDGSGLSVPFVEVASSSNYPDGVDANTTNFTYTWYTGSTDSDEISEEVTTLPAVAVTQNGSGDTTETKEVFATNGEFVWQESALGSFTFDTFDPVTGMLTESVSDATSYTGSIAPPDTLPSSGINATTDINYDALRRAILTFGPDFTDAAGDLVRTTNATSYLDVTQQVRTASGFEVVTPAEGSAYSEGESVLVNPISISISNLDGQVTDEIQAEDGTSTEVADTALADLDSTSFASSTTSYPWSRWTHFDYASQASSSGYYGAGQMTDMQVYTDINATTPAYTETFYRYNTMGLESAVLDPTGNIAETDYSVLGLVTTVSIGTSDGTLWPGEIYTTDSNMFEVTANVYDGGAGGGDGLLTQTTEYTGTSSRVTEYGYDWRDRSLWTMVNSGTYMTFTFNTLDNLGDVTESQEYNDTDDTSLAEIDATPGTGDVLIADSTAQYDNLGYVYQTTTYGVDPTDGAETSGSVTTDYWRDGDGNIIKEQDGTQEFTKTVYNGLEEPIAVYVGIASTPEPIATTGTYTAALDLDDDTFLTQTDTNYDAAGDATFVTTYARYDSASTSDYGPLTSSDAQVSYVGMWYDGIGRSVETANYGSPGSAVTRPDAAPALSTTVMVNMTNFNARGEPWQTFDAAGNETETFDDDAGRTIETIQNVSLTIAADTNITTDYTFETGTPLLADMSVTTENAAGTGTQTQITAYVYGTATGDSSPLIYRNDLVRAVITGLNLSDDLSDIVTNVSSGDTSGYNIVEYAYNALGETIQMGVTGFALAKPRGSKG